MEKMTIFELNNYYQNTERRVVYYFLNIYILNRSLFLVNFLINSMSLNNHILIHSLLFMSGLFGIIINRKNLISILLSIEIILVSVNLNLIFFSVYLDDVMGELFALLILTVAASESAIGLALIIVFFRLRGTIAISQISLLCT